MKLKAIVLGIIAAVILAACYPLVSPMHDRINPYDENSTLPIAEAGSFTAVYNNTAGAEVNLSWTPIEATGEQRRDGYLVVRKVGTAPTNVLDGTYAGQFEPSDDGSGYSDFVDSIDDDIIEGPQAGYVNYYGLFAYYTEEENPPSVTNTDENGNLSDTDYYIFAGPMVASVSVPEETTLQLDILKRWIIDSGDVWTESYVRAGLSYIAVDDYDQNIGSILKFDTADIEGKTLEGATLTLTKSNTNAETCDILIDYITSEWTVGSTDFITEITMPAFVDDSLGIQVPLSGYNADDATTIDDPAILEMVQNWADGETNLGFRILLDETSVSGGGPNDFTYDFTDTWPVLEVTYWDYPD